MEKRIEGETITMRTGCDCMVASLAMLLNTTYDESAQYFPPKAINQTGYTWDLLIPYLRRNKIYVVRHDEETLQHVDWTKPAMVDVPSLTAPDKGDHIIFWDGERVIDPSVKHLKYSELPEKINTVVQLKSLPSNLAIDKNK